MGLKAWKAHEGIPQNICVSVGAKSYKRTRRTSSGRYTIQIQTDESDQDPLEAPEDREKKRRSRLQLASPKTKAILDKLGVETIEVLSTPLPDIKAGEVHPIATPVMEALSDGIYPNPPPSPQPDTAELARGNLRLRRRLDGLPDEPENCNTDPNLQMSAANTWKATEPEKVYPFQENARPSPNARKNDAKKSEVSNDSPDSNATKATAQSGETSPRDLNPSPHNQTSQQPSPPLSITPRS